MPIKGTLLSNRSRIILFIASIALIGAYFFPVWFIFLTAPQYPEGLTMNIWLNKLSGEVEIINGLNHYIGMKHIKAEMFPEFNYLIYVVAFFISLGLITAITGKRKLLVAYLVLTLVGAAAAMYDFYKWGYEYGHNLDPTAPIQIPGFSYQPPLIGHKTLLNFDAYSYPDIGGWIIIAISSIFFMVWIWEWRQDIKKKYYFENQAKKLKAALAGVMILLLTSCTSQPEPFSYGKDVCAECRMTIMDAKYGGEIITSKGKIYKYDDAHCLAKSIETLGVKPGDNSKLLFINYEKENDFVDASTVFFVTSPSLKSPMGSNTVALSNKQSAEKIANVTGGKLNTWSELMVMLSKSGLKP